MDITPILAFFDVRNKLDAIFFQFRIKKTVTLRVYGQKFKISNVSLPYTLGVLYNVFRKQIYKDLEIQGKKVIDVGGYIGDSSIYFASRGASKVYSVEAYPQLANLIKENAKLNRFKIEVINATISPKKYEAISENVLVSGKLMGGGRRKVRGLRITKLPKADVLKINLDHVVDSYIMNEMPVLKKKYVQIYWKRHFKNSNRIIVIGSKLTQSLR